MFTNDHICIPCAYHSAPRFSVLRVNRFWTSSSLHEVTGLGGVGGPDTLWGFPRFPGHCRSWNPVATQQFLGNFEGPNFLKGCNWKSHRNMRCLFFQYQTEKRNWLSFHFAIKTSNYSWNIPRNSWSVPTFKVRGPPESGLRILFAQHGSWIICHHLSMVRWRVCRVTHMLGHWKKENNV